MLRSQPAGGDSSRQLAEKTLAVRILDIHAGEVAIEWMATSAMGCTLFG
jgi:hypothetical protein